MKKNLKKATILSLAIVFFFTISVSATDGIRKDLDNLKNTFSLINYSVTGGNITGIPVGFNFTNNLSQGVKRIDVLYLQKILNSDIQTRVSTTGPGSPGSETDYFGPATTGAVKRFQEKYASEILTPFGLTTPTGFVGQSTMAKLNQLLKTTDTDEDSEIVKMLKEIQRAIDELSQRVDRLEGEEGKYIKIISPKEGDVWEVGKSYDIKWDSTGVESVNIWIVGDSFLIDGAVLRKVCMLADNYECYGPCGAMIAENINASANSYSWVPGKGYEGSIIIQEKVKDPKNQSCVDDGNSVSIHYSQESKIEECRRLVEDARSSLDPLDKCLMAATLMVCPHSPLFIEVAENSCVAGELQKRGWLTQKDIVSGVVCSKMGGSILIASNRSCGGEFGGDMWVRIINKTAIVDRGGKSISANDIKVGDSVTIQHTGWVLESYPSEIDALKIILE